MTEGTWHTQPAYIDTQAVCVCVYIYIYIYISHEHVLACKRVTMTDLDLTDPT